jgi:hypothetical protein
MAGNITIFTNEVINIKTNDALVLPSLNKKIEKSPKEIGYIFLTQPSLRIILNSLLK